MEMDQLALYQCGRCVCFPTALQWGTLWNFRNLEVCYIKFCLTAIFPFQTETIQVTLSLESRSEGKVDFKAYKDYFTAGAHWNIIILLILVNIAAQVNKDICFGLRPQLDIYILFVLYLLFIIIVNRYFKRFMSKNWLTRRWDLGG